MISLVKGCLPCLPEVYTIKPWSPVGRTKNFVGTGSVEELQGFHHDPAAILEPQGSLPETQAGKLTEAGELLAISSGRVHEQLGKSSKAFSTTATVFRALLSAILYCSSHCASKHLQIPIDGAA